MQVFEQEFSRERSQKLYQRMQEHILVFDGAMGTSIQKMDLTADDFGGEEYEGCNEHLVLTRPEIIKEVHRSFLEAGADIIETDTFGSTPFVLDEYKLGDKAYEISRRAAELAREAAAEFDRADKPRFVAGSVGPTTKALSLTGGISFDDLVENFLVQLRGLQDGGADLFLLETAQDTLNLKAAGLAIEKLEKESGIHMPVMVSGTIETMGTTLAGQNIEALAVSVAHIKPISIGLNCATGPEFMTDHIRTLASLTPYGVSCIPNAGLPDEEGHYHESPQAMAEALDRFASQGWVNFVGGCCGTTPDHIARLSEVALKHKPRKASVVSTSYLTGMDLLDVADDKRPLLISERTNVIGSKKFKDLIIEGKWDEAAEIARKQVKSGAQIVDVCMSNPDRDEMEDMKNFMPILLKKIKAPIMVDSTDHLVMEEALKMIQGKSLLNSVNLENGEERFEKIVPLAKRYGAALVVGTIDDDPEQGMGVTVERKLEIAQRSYDLLVNKYNFPEEDIYFDALVFPVGTGDEKYIGSAEMTIKGVKAIKEKFPRCKTTLGISNVSFGLPAAGREVLNSVFLYHNVIAGLDTAIVNAQKLKRYASLSNEEKRLAENLIFHTPENYSQVLTEFSEFFKGKKVESVSEDEKRNWTPEQRIHNCIVEGSRENLLEDLDTLRLEKGMSPMDIINGPLMEGMKEVGKLFNDNQLIVAEVLQSAEAMKYAVSHLEQFMDKKSDSSKGRLLLATVKGDVHDIGKNLVDIVLSNNGYEVINLGIKIPPEKLISAYHEHKPDFIGLSGLLVKSAQQMVITAEDLSQEGIDIPLVVGGAALTKNFVLKKIAPAYKGTSIYAKDAMDGLDIFNQISDSEKRADFLNLWKNISNADSLSEKDNEDAKMPSENKREELKLTYDYGLKKPADLKIHSLPGEGYNKRQIFETAFSYINPGMLFKRHLGFRGNTQEAEKSGDPKYRELTQIVEKVQDLLVTDERFAISAVYGFFNAAGDGDNVIIFNSERSKEISRIRFPRQKSGWKLCASDFVAPLNSGQKDYIGIFVTSAGKGIRQKAEEFKQQGEYLLSHALQSVALESAEGLAEWLHQRMRDMWGWKDNSDWTLKKLFATRYQGIRLSFGYPACPNLEDQAKIWQLLEPDKRIGVNLTEEFMMDPEASVSALVFQHPEGRYFAVDG